MNTPPSDRHTRNIFAEKAFRSLIKSVKGLIASQEDRHYRSIVEIDHKVSRTSRWMIYELISPQFYLLLERDTENSYWISFGMDQRSPSHLNVRFMRVVFEQTQLRGLTAGLMDTLKLDHVFLSTDCLFEHALRNQPIQNIDILDYKNPDSSC